MARTGDECHGGDAGVWPVDMSVGAERSPLKRVRGAVLPPPSRVFITWLRPRWTSYPPNGTAVIPIPAGGDGPHDPVVSRLLDMITLTERPNTPSAVLIDHTQPHLLSLVAVGTCRFHITHDLPWFVTLIPCRGTQWFSLTR